MTDIALQLLQQAVAEDTRRCLWIVDENVPVAAVELAPRETLTLLTNRCDIASALRARGFDTVLSDFAWRECADAFEAVYYRVSKEKPIVHHVLNECAATLAEGAELVIAGYKREGTKTYIAKAAQLLGERRELTRGRDTAMLARVGIARPRGRLDDKDYATLREVHSADGLRFISKPGIYGWQKVDAGSAFLAGHLPAFLTALPRAPERLIDLGCGYGYLSMMAAQLCDAEMIATDNNVAAVEACRANFRRYDIGGEVVLADCGDAISRPADVILCNPPFHQGFATSKPVTERFVQACSRLLKRNGCALFVVNTFIPLQEVAAARFARVEEVARDRQFTLIAVYR